MGISTQPSQHFTAFDPDTAAAMGLAFDSAWQRLIVSGSELIAAHHAEKTREALALRIIHKVRLGERDIVALRDDAVAHAQRLAAAAGRAPMPQPRRPLQRELRH